VPEPPAGDKPASQGMYSGYQPEVGGWGVGWGLSTLAGAVEECVLGCSSLPALPVQKPTSGICSPPPPPSPPPAQYVVIMSERRLPEPPRAPRPGGGAGGSDDCKKRKGGGCAAAGSDGGGSFSSGGSDDDDDSEGYGYLSGMLRPRPQHERFGTPVLVPFPCAFSDKGTKAEPHLRKVGRGGGAAGGAREAPHAAAPGGCGLQQLAQPSPLLGPASTPPPDLQPNPESAPQCFDTALKPFFAEGSSLGLASMPFIKLCLTAVSWGERAGTGWGCRTLGP
jgi:hypothetical protein